MKRTQFIAFISLHEILLQKRTVQHSLNKKEEKEVVVQEIDEEIRREILSVNLPKNSCIYPFLHVREHEALEIDMNVVKQIAARMKDPLQELPIAKNINPIPGVGWVQKN